jgi:PIN domain nuclease of toxin-antitoxin system
VILLDTHVWIWWVHETPMPWEIETALEDRNKGEELAVSAISCWEVAKLVERGRLDLKMDVGFWLASALGPSGITLLHLTPQIAAEACDLPGEFHRDPADQIIVATSRIYDIPLVTADQKIRGYPYVDLFDGMTIHDG